MTTNVQDLIRRVQAIAPLPHTAAEPVADRAVIVGSNGRVLGWVATTSGDYRAVAELWSLAPTIIQTLVQRVVELSAENDQLCGDLDKILDYCESGKWEHGYDGDESGSWTTCDGRATVKAMASDALKPEAPHGRLRRSRRRRLRHAAPDRDLHRRMPGRIGGNAMALSDRVRRITNPAAYYAARWHRMAVLTTVYGHQEARRWHRTEVTARRPDLWRRWEKRHARGVYRPGPGLLTKRLTRIFFRAMLTRASLWEAQRTCGWVTSEMRGGE